ncbi:hypothetical protein ABVT39_024663 [Epinephelus coioides]
MKVYAHEEAARHVDYGYREHPDSSDSEPELVEVELATEDKQPNLRKDLASWATSTKQAHNSVNELLNILRKHGRNLPKDARTLLQTPRHVESMENCSGQYIYLGLESSIVASAQVERPSITGTVLLDINIDGVPLHKSSQTQFWPILAKIDKADPFIVAFFCGKTKPKPVEDFLQDLVEEFLILQERGIVYKGTLFEVNVNAFICDSPARAFVKCIKGHNAYQL